MLPQRSAFLGLLCLFASPLCFGQHVLLVKDGDEKPAVVVGARGIRPVVLKDGKEAMSNGDRFAMIEGGAYMFAFVSVRNVTAQSSSLSINGSSGINKEFRFSCDLESGYDLENVFMVLLMKTQDAGKSIFVFEVGNLEAREVKPFSLRVPLSVELGAGSYELHLFAGGRELFHSKLPFGAMDLALNKVVRDKIKDVKNANAQPLVGPGPEYPKALRKKKIEGKAVVSISIDAAGNVQDPSVAEATQPEFGEAVMEVIRQWRFLPKVVEGKAVPSKAKLPFVFALPKKKS